MLQAIKELGELKLGQERRGVTDLVSILVENPNDKGRYPYILVVVFEEEESRFKYCGVQPEQTDESKIARYLYKFYAPNGPDYTPTARISQSLRKTFQNKIEAWFKNNPPKTELLSRFNDAFFENKDRILKDLELKWKNLKGFLSQNQDCVTTFTIKRGETIDYLGDIEEFKKLLIDKVKTRYQEISKQEHICSICGEITDEVYGNAIPISFYTIDKPGYIAGGFNKQEAWKNAPICLGCSLKIEEGKKLFDECLTFRMGGQRYYLIPKFIIGGKDEEELVFEFFRRTDIPPETLAERAIRKLSEDEREILTLLGELKDGVIFNFLFFETPTRSTFKINLLVEEILPSRLRQIFQAKERADSYDLLHNVKIKRTKYEDIEFRFDGFKRVTPSNKAFLEIVNQSFKGLPVNRDLILTWIMDRVRRDFANDRYIKPLVLQGLSALLFFGELGLFKQNREIKGGELMTELSKLAENFFVRYPGTFPQPAHKALFLLGVITQKLLNIQYMERRSTPFRRKLKGLRMEEEDFRGLLPKIQDKLEEYGKSYKSLEALISEYWLLAGRGWDISTDEMNFYFVLGMNLQNETSGALKLKKEEIEEEVES